MGWIPMPLDTIHGNCHAYGMKTSVMVDDFGRLVLPKPIREALGVFGRTVLVIEVVGEKAEMEIASTPRSDLSRKGGRTVFSGSLPEGWDSGGAVTEMRARRLRRT